jgi:hypothetical protein
MVSFQLHDNPLTGTIPSELGNLLNLQYFYLRGANMSGTIPESFSNLTKLKVFFISACGIEGELPGYLGNFPDLYYIHLSDNKFTGEIPSNYQNLSKLEILVLHNNQLSGGLPMWLKNIPSVTSIYLGGNSNSMTGNLDNFLGDWPNLNSLSIANFYFGEAFPSKIGNYTNLTYLNLGGNDLTGEIPQSFNNLKALKHIYLHRNKLTGEFDIDLNSMPNLKLVLLNEAGDLTVVPNLSSHPNIANLNYQVANNMLTFESIEANLTGPDTYDYAVHAYSPQTSPIEVVTTQYASGQELTLVNGQAGGNQTNYQWQEWDGAAWINVDGSNDANYTFTPTSVEDGKMYRCEMTNNWVSGMTLYSRIFGLENVGRMLYAVADGTWEDTNTWSDVVGGQPIDYYPHATDVVMINGFEIKVMTEAVCRGIEIANAEGGKLEVSGEDTVLTINGEVKITGSAIAAEQLLVVKNGAKIECK